MTVLEHSGRVNSRDCPTLGCSRPRDARAQLDFADGTRSVVTACENCIAWYAARAVMRHVKYTGGQEAVVAYVDDPVRRCIP